MSLIYLDDSRLIGAWLIGSHHDQESGALS
jgi:hypothetical protein